MIIKYSEKLTKIHGDYIFSCIEKSSINKIVSYVINSKYRKAVNLKSWIKPQVVDSNILELASSLTLLISTEPDYDAQMFKIFSWVKKNITYVGDLKSWSMNEYWQTAEETLNLRTGDCEDGAILMYVLARLVGIPSNRLMLFAGWVKEGFGHCYLGYKPKNYPHNFVFMDWCYYPNNRSIKTRNLMVLKNKIVKEYSVLRGEFKEIESNYKDIWFGFNEEVAITDYIGWGEI